MPNSTPSPAVPMARQLASRAGTKAVPCPVCAASLRADRLEKHLRKVHEITSPAGEGSLNQSWRGVDKRMGVLSLLGLVPWTAAFFAVVLTVEDPTQQRLLHSVLAGLFVLVCIPPVLAFAGKFKATLTISDKHLQLRYALGLLQKTIPIPEEIGVGQLRARAKRHVVVHSDPDFFSPSDDVKAGVYLRLTTSRGTLLVGSRKGTAFRKHWDPSGWRDAPRRRGWDITLDRPSMVQLEHHLAHRGLLAPRDA